MFLHSVSHMDEIMIDRFKSKCMETYEKVFPMGPKIKIELNEKEVGYNLIEKEDQNDFVEAEDEIETTIQEITPICRTCKMHLSKGKVPAMSVANNLGLVRLPNSSFKLSELENNLIAKRILFQKIYQLPKSRMSGMKDRLINIPIYEQDVINTIENIPIYYYIPCCSLQSSGSLLQGSRGYFDSLLLFIILYLSNFSLNFSNIPICCVKFPLNIRL